MLRKVVVGSGLVALIPTVSAATPIQNEPQKPPPMRPSDLPIYESPHADYAEYIETKTMSEQTSFVRSKLREPVKSVRETVQGVLAQTDSFTQSIRDNVNEFQDRTDWIVKYLREEENKEVRYGAVVMGGLTGFIFGLRGGFFKKLFYASVGTSVMGVVCFPEETKEVYKENSALVKQYANIAYNFLYGVKPGDPQLELSFPDLHVPKNFSEFVDLSASVASTIKKAVLPPPKDQEGQAQAKNTDKKE